MVAYGLPLNVSPNAKSISTEGDLIADTVVKESLTTASDGKQ